MRYYNTREVCEILGMHKITVRRLAKEGKLPAVMVGHRWRFPADKIDNLYREQQGGVAEERCSYESQSS